MTRVLLVALLGLNLWAFALAQPVAPAPALTIVKDLSATRTASGFTLSGSLMTSSTCMVAEFVLKEARYEAIQYQPVSTLGRPCGFISGFQKVTTSFADPSPPAHIIVVSAGDEVQIR